MLWARTFWFEIIEDQLQVNLQPQNEYLFKFCTIPAARIEVGILFHLREQNAHRPVHVIKVARDKHNVEFN